MIENNFHTRLFSKLLTQIFFTIEFPVYNLFCRVISHDLRKMQKCSLIETAVFSRFHGHRKNLHVDRLIVSTFAKHNVA
jgi:hypothetical protein